MQEVTAELQEKKERQDNVNFKMVTFSLSGKDYGVDIMNIKEIAKADKFTYVPNAAGFVRGVYNLRGDIIPIIDLRLFFHLPLGKPGDGQENLLILHIEDRVYGTIVDKIDKVVGVNVQAIQPPHPIFGDINIKYITGVVEQTGSLYIILDVVRIFSPNQAVNQKTGEKHLDFTGAAAAAPDAAPPTADERRGYSDNDLAFIKDSLAALQKFYAGPLNERWIESRLAEWGKSRSLSNIQLKDADEAREFLDPFYSPFTGGFWSEGYADALKDILPDMPSNNIQVWNPGCGKGYESFSLACLLKVRYPDAHIKIWANDSDIMAIANAPNMVFNPEGVPEFCRGFLVKGKNGSTFNAAIKDSIVFEYHDVAHGNTLPDIDIVFIRDLLSFLPEKTQSAMIDEIRDRLKKTGLIVTGAHELMPEGWKNVGKDDIPAFVRV
ncbi:MAG: chemotaxis protein CheW [Spirochaetaceae bacterium]|nr:chemotaxis protein CheW [Spirochaetaceae bacterium]